MGSRREEWLHLSYSENKKRSAPKEGRSPPPAAGREDRDTDSATHDGGKRVKGTKKRDTVSGGRGGET